MDNAELVLCPICSGETEPLFAVPCDYRKPTVPCTYQIVWCQQCSYGQIWKRPTKSEVIGFYELDHYYTHDSKDISGGRRESVPFFDKVMANISWRLDKGRAFSVDEVQHLLQSPHATVCEIGCGNGVNLRKFRDAGFTVHGVEPDPVARQQAQMHIDNVVDGSAEDLPEAIANQKYDVVLMSHVLEHCLDIDKAIVSAKNILKENGIFVIETPNCQAHGFRDYQGVWPWSDVPRHLNFFTPTSLTGLLVKHNLNVVSKNYCGFTRQFAKWWLSTEKEVWSAFANHGAGGEKMPNFKGRAWWLLLKSAFSKKHSKYDSVRVVAAK